MISGEAGPVSPHSEGTPVSEQNPNEGTNAEGSDPSTPASPTPAEPTSAASTPTSPTPKGETVPPKAAETKGAAEAATPAADATAGEDEVWLYEEIDDESPAAPATGVAATFLPGIDAGAVIAAILSVLGAGVYLLVYPLVQAKAGVASWNNFKNKVPQAQQDPFTTERTWAEYQSWGHIILGLAAILVALLVLGLWTAQKNKTWSRSVAQAALVVGLAVVIYGILMKTGAIGGGLPSTKTIQNDYTQLGSSGTQ
jgi:hypothetical protein